MAEQLDDIRSICGVLVPGPADLRLAAQIADQHELTFYDALHAAVARSRGAVLATADAALLSSGTGETPAALGTRLEIGGAA